MARKRRTKIIQATSDIGETIARKDSRDRESDTEYSMNMKRLKKLANEAHEAFIGRSALQAKKKPVPKERGQDV